MPHSEGDNRSSAGVSDEVGECQETLLGSQNESRDDVVSMSLGWPNLDANQQAMFLDWFFARFAKQQLVLQKAIEHEMSQAELAQKAEHVSEGTCHVNRIKELRDTLNKLESEEHLRQEAWRFNFNICVSKENTAE